MPRETSDPWAPHVHPARGRGRGLSLLDMLFTRTQQRVLGVLFGHPGRRFHVNEIIGLAGVGRGSVSRELLRLQASRLAVAKRDGRRKCYQANARAAVYEELCGLFRKTAGCAACLRDALKPISGDIDFAFIFGSVAKGTETATSDIDLLAVSDRLSGGGIYPHLLDPSGKLGREIALVHYTREQFRTCYSPEDSFLRRVLAGPIVLLAGSREKVDELCSGKP